MTKRNVSIFDKIGTLIPGYDGYAIRDEKRRNDKKLRDEISVILNQVETLIEKYQVKLIRTGETNMIKEWELTRKTLNTTSTKIKYANYGESSFFSNAKIKETELTEIYNMDYELVALVNSIYKTVDLHIHEETSVSIVNKHLEQISNILEKRNTFIRKYK